MFSDHDFHNGQSLDACRCRRALYVGGSFDDHGHELEPYDAAMSPQPLRGVAILRRPCVLRRFLRYVLRRKLIFGTYFCKLAVVADV